jgi:hypothetical protein
MAQHSMTGRRRAGAAELRAVAAEAQARTLAARALKAVRRAQQRGQSYPAEGVVAMTGAQRADRAAEAEAARVRTAGDVARVWREAMQDRYGKAYAPSAWTVPQRRFAKMLLHEYGWDLVEAVVTAIIANAPTEDPPTIDLLYAARGRVFDAWQLRGEVPRLSMARKRGGDEVRERKKNFDEWDGPEGGGRLD